MKYREIYVKNALSRSKIRDVEYSLNPYRGCEHRCSYCYAPFVLHIPNEKWNSEVLVKINLPTVLDRELKKIGTRVHVLIGSVTDGYQPAEKKYEITRKSLAVLLKYGARVNILTKSPLIARDKEIIEKFEYAEVGISVSTLDEIKRKKTEPFSAEVEERFNALSQFSSKVRKYVFLGPIFTHTLNELEGIFSKASEIGVDYIIADRFRRREGMRVPAAFYEGIDYGELGKKLKNLEKRYDLPVFFSF